MSEAKAKIFTSGGSQAVRLPRAFRMEEGEVTVRRLGKGVFLEPSAQGGRALWDRIDAIEADQPMLYPEQPYLKEIGLDAWDVDG